MKFQSFTRAPVAKPLLPLLVAPALALGWSATAGLRTSGSARL
jgi:hypothetical protein